MGGPVGLVVGALLGGAAGVALSIAHRREDRERSRRDEAIDREIGVIDGSLGASNLHHAPARFGAYSPASLGVETPSGGPIAEGPIPEADA
jgi:hypothetical protein